MSGLRPHMEHGPESYLANVNMLAGRLVEFDAQTGRVKYAAVNSLVVLGLLIGDVAGAPIGMVPQTTDFWGRPTNGGLTPPQEGAVAYRGSWWIKNESGAAWTPGQALYSGANGILQGATTTGRLCAIVISGKDVAIGSEGLVRLQLG